MDNGTQHNKHQIRQEAVTLLHLPLYPLHRILIIIAADKHTDAQLLGSIGSVAS